MVESIVKYFRGLPDPRHPRGRRHRLDELVTRAILALICGADSWQEVAQWARAKRKWLKTFMNLPHGPPSHDTMGRVFAAIRPEAFERCFLAWIQVLAKRSLGELTAIDGKTLRRSFDCASGAEAMKTYRAVHATQGLSVHGCKEAATRRRADQGCCTIR